MGDAKCLLWRSNLQLQLLLFCLLKILSLVSLYPLQVLLACVALCIPLFTFLAPFRSHMVPVPFHQLFHPTCILVPLPHITSLVLSICSSCTFLSSGCLVVQGLGLLHALASASQRTSPVLQHLLRFYSLPPCSAQSSANINGASLRAEVSLISYTSCTTLP